MADKTTFLRAFNTHFFEFMDDIIKIFPENVDVAASKTFFEVTKKANPIIIVKIWFQFVSSPYGEVLANGDLEYFINKDYSEDVANLPNSKDVLASIDGLRASIKEMTPDNKVHSLKYLQNLNKLANAYGQ
jgi:hypothetical protein